MTITNIRSRTTIPRKGSTAASPNAPAIWLFTIGSVVGAGAGDRRACRGTSTRSGTTAVYEKVLTAPERAAAGRAQSRRLELDALHVRRSRQSQRPGADSHRQAPWSCSCRKPPRARLFYPGQSRPRRRRKSLPRLHLPVRRSLARRRCTQPRPAAQASRSDEEIDESFAIATRAASALGAGAAVSRLPAQHPASVSEIGDPPALPPNVRPAAARRRRHRRTSGPSIDLNLTFTAENGYPVAAAATSSTRAVR